MHPRAQGVIVGLVSLLGLAPFSIFAFIGFAFAAAAGPSLIAFLLPAICLAWLVASVLCFARPRAARPALTVAATLLLVLPVLFAATTVADSGDWGPRSWGPVAAGGVAATLLWVALYLVPAWPWLVALTGALAVGPVLAPEDGYLIIVPSATVLLMAVGAALLPRGLRPPRGSRAHAPRSGRPRG